ncbi:unnamed protein product [Brassica rapa subsp. trilocularis]
MEEEIPMMPHNTFLTLRYRLLINIATASNYLPAPLHIYLHVSCSSRIVRLVITDNASALFRDMHIKSVMRYKVLLITSVNARVIKGKLTLATTTATRFYCDSSIDPIQHFIRKYEVDNHS